MGYECVVHSKHQTDDDCSPYGSSSDSISELSEYSFVAVVCGWGLERRVDR